MEPEQSNVLDPAQTGLSAHWVPLPQTILGSSTPVFHAFK